METPGRIAQTPDALDFTVENVEKVGFHSQIIKDHVVKLYKMSSSAGLLQSVHVSLNRIHQFSNPIKTVLLLRFCVHGLASETLHTSPKFFRMFRWFSSVRAAYCDTFVTEWLSN